MPEATCITFQMLLHAAAIKSNFSTIQIFYLWCIIIYSFSPSAFNIFHLYISFSAENSTYEIVTYLLFMLLRLSCIWARTINSTNIFDCYLEIVGWLHRVAWIHHESLQLKGARGKRKLLLDNILSNEL